MQLFFLATFSNEVTYQSSLCSHLINGEIIGVFAATGNFTAGYKLAMWKSSPLLYNLDYNIFALKKDPFYRILKETHLPNEFKK